MIAPKQTKPAKAVRTRRGGGISPKPSIKAFADSVMEAATSSPVRGYYVPMGLRKHSASKALAGYGGPCQPSDVSFLSLKETL